MLRARKDMQISVVKLDSAENTREKTADEIVKTGIKKVTSANSQESLARQNTLGEQTRVAELEEAMIPVAIAKMDMADRIRDRDTSGMAVDSVI